MSGDTEHAPVVSDLKTGAVTADLSDHDEPIARPAHWVASIMWLILVVTCALVAVASAGALILDFLAGGTSASGSKDTVLLLFSMSFNGLIALFVTKPGAR